MKKLLVYLSASAITFLFGFTFYSYSPTGISEAEVLDLANQLHRAEKYKDEEKLKDILADHLFRSHHKDERFLTKEQIIENIVNAECEIEPTEMTFVFTEVESDRVKVSFVMQQRFLWADGNRSEHKADYIYTFEKQQDKWELTAIHLEN